MMPHCSWSLAVDGFGCRVSEPRLRLEATRAGIKGKIAALKHQLPQAGASNYTVIYFMFTWPKTLVGETVQLRSHPWDMTGQVPEAEMKGSADDWTGMGLARSGCREVSS